jgi:HEAT repeat protein
MLEGDLKYIAIATCMILVVLSITLLYLILRKALENHLRSQVNAEQQRLREPIVSFLFEGTFLETFNSESLIQKRALEGLLSQLAELLEGEAEKNNLYLLANSFLKDYYQKGLSSRKWSIRMNALYHIEDFQIRSLEEYVIKLLESRNTSKEEKIQGLRILSLFGNKELYHLLTQNSIQFSDYDYRSILILANKEALDTFVLGFHQCQQALKLAILDVIGIKKELSYSKFLESIFKWGEDEIKLRALKSIGAIGFVENISSYLPLCESPKWQERMMMAKLLGAFPEEAGLDCLIKMLHDSSWWVRFQSGQAITNFPNGKQVLQKVYQTSTDSFARDMAWEWLNKGD